MNRRPSSALKFFDVNLRGRYYDAGLIREFLNYADVFKINDDEILTVRRLFSLAGSDEEVCRTLLAEYGLRYLIFTAGENYSVIYSPQARSYLPTPKVEVVDTVGAGRRLFRRFCLRNPDRQNDGTGPSRRRPRFRLRLYPSRRLARIHPGFERIEKWKKDLTYC